jgi:hypothetical protein
MTTKRCMTHATAMHQIEHPGNYKMCSSRTTPADKLRHTPQAGVESGGIGKLLDWFR